MPNRTKDQNTLVVGEYNVLCDVCGFKFKVSDIRDRWDGLRVCRDDWEARHPSDFFRGRKDNQSVPEARPDDEGTQLANTNTDIQGNTFPPTENTTQTDIGRQVDEDGDNIPDGTFGKNNSTL